MRPLRYVRPQDPEEAAALVAVDPRARFLGGGTNIVDLMKLGVERPTRLVDVSRVLDDTVEETPAGGLRIGAGARNSDVAADPLVRARYPVIAQALLAGASGQLRNMATTGGNLLQRTRCLYFQDLTKPCNKREPGTGCPAREGEHRGLAILGASEECVATHPSDLAVALAACDALVLTSKRWLALDELYRPPSDNPHRDTMLDHGELILAIELPPSAPGLRSRYRKVRDRASYSFALVSIAAALDLEGDTGAVRDVRIALGGVAYKPWRASTAESMLIGSEITTATLTDAAEAELEHSSPLPDNAFKVTLARNLIVDVLGELAAP
ncbi:MAG TPA: xanthine dehydrogenase family protein subunit M [Solirubrobacteraceae bacterium]|jgi:xanthine dehydrogenase YagS FAD-binding subunit|nr:xanthine dehydrogenase family protein subunit M [Solirubrobacteraceae bacterium]